MPRAYKFLLLFKTRFNMNLHNLYGEDIYRNISSKSK